MRVQSVGALAALALLATAQSAAATGYTYSFSGSDPAGAYTASIVLDIVNGQALSGSHGTISGAGINGSQSLFLLTAASADVSAYAGGGYQKGGNDGTDIVFDTSIPIDNNGLAFTIGGISTGHDDQPILNVYGQPSTGYFSFFAGKQTSTFNALTQTLFGGGSTTFTSAAVSVSAAPEPGVWTLLVAGVAMLGAALRLGRRREGSAAAA